MNYRYSDPAVQGDPERYMYSPFEGRGFLDAYARSREGALKALGEVPAASDPGGIQDLDARRRRFESGKGAEDPVRLQACLLARWDSEGRLQDLNAALKIGDLICSRIGELAADSRPLAARTLRRELAAVKGIALP